EEDGQAAGPRRLLPAGRAVDRLDRTRRAERRRERVLRRLRREERRVELRTRSAGGGGWRLLPVGHAVQERDAGRCPGQIEPRLALLDRLVEPEDGEEVRVAARLEDR